MAKIEMNLTESDIPPKAMLVNIAQTEDAMFPDPTNSTSPESDIGQCRLRGDKNHEQQSQCRERIHSFDKITIQFQEKFITKYGGALLFPKFKWKKSFYDHIIRNQKDYDNHWNYTMYNFKKHGLPENWQYTGLNYPEMLDEME